MKAGWRSASASPQEMARAHAIEDYLQMTIARAPVSES